MSKFTAGPWEFVPKLTASENHKGFFVRAEKTTRNGKWAFAEVQPGDEDGKLGEANARLIAAAPELLDALQELDNCISETRGTDATEALSKARAAIAKATGETA